MSIFLLCIITYIFIININVNLNIHSKMLKIFGKNNNNLFRQSQKQTYSMPQSLPFSQPILKCACGYDHIAILTASGRLYFVFQAKFYHAENVPVLWDIAASQNTIAMYTRNSEILVWDFDQDKLMKQSVNYTKIKVELEHGDSIKKIQMGYNDIFLISQIGKVYHFKRNEWYQTKTYSNIQSIELNHRIIDACSGPVHNFFISYQGLLFTSSKQNPFCLSYVQTVHKFIKVASNQYNVGTTKKGELMIWGNSIHGNYKEPTEFSKLTKKFVDVKLDKENGYALADDGQVWVWGLNSNGELGLSDYEVRVKPFPLITLQKNYVHEIFCGYSYACCLCQPNQKDSKNSIKVVNRTVSQLNAVRQQTMQSKKKQKGNLFNEYLQYEIRENNHIHEQSPSFPKKQAERKSNVKKSSCSPSTSLKNSQIHKKKNSNISQDSHSMKKSAQKFRQTSAKPKIQKQAKSKSKIYQSDWLISERQNDYSKDYQGYGQQNNHPQSSLQLEIIQLKQENYRLKQKVSEQQDIIGDITCKIRLLEQAIDEHERNLTSRDHILQQYQIKQQDYITHIQELQSKIDQIVRNKQKNNEITVIYEDLKTNFEKQRSYYIEKIKDYEIKLHMQQSKNQQKYDEHKGRSILNPCIINKQNSRPTWSSHSPIKAKPDVIPIDFIRKGQVNDRQNANTSSNMNMNSSMEQVIDQIESNKSRITKSANKLIAMLDISQ